MRGADRRRGEAFDPARHERALVAIIDGVAASPGLGARDLDRLLKRHPKDGRGLYSRSDLLAGFRRFGVARHPRLSEVEFESRLRLRPVRTLSGVTPVTVLTRPFPCPGRCIFCPNDVRMPKSYLSDEPGAQRAEANRFDPYLQTWNRLDAYRSIGHPVAKVELIVLGGTWSFHPEPYQVWFVTRCLEALNDFGAGIDGRARAGAPPPDRGGPPEPEGDGGSSYNRRVRRRLAREHGASLLPPGEGARWDALARAQRANETAGCRNVGLVVETRPDWVTLAEVERIRRLGGTKVQLGIQSLSDRVLARNRRGCDVAAARRAVRLLRGAALKIQAHWMANLLDATPEGDARDFARLFEDPDFRPDELKLYPCSLVESADLVAWWRRGEWRPYERGELVGLLVDCLRRTPPWCRVTRVIRDFSAQDIVTGNKIANLREVAERELAASGGRCRDVRAREIRGDPFRADQLALRERRYATSIGEERFLEVATPDDRLVGFLRLSLPDAPPPLAELRGSALVREVHVYGGSLDVGRRRDGSPQHRGLGRRLVERAARIAREAGYLDLAVVSAVGTRVYYRRLGFRDGALYQHRAL